MTNRHWPWREVAEGMEYHQITLGWRLSYRFQHAPRGALFALSRYKFAAKMIGRQKRVLDIRCGEGLGTWLLAVECGFARGLDSDESAILVAQANWSDPRVEFLRRDFLEHQPEPWDAVVGFSALEHLPPASRDRFLRHLSAHVAHDGVAVIGAPHATPRGSSSGISGAGYVDVCPAETLEAEMRRYFAHVFIFGINGEVVRTGLLPAADYLVALACQKHSQP